MAYLDEDGLSHLIGKMKQTFIRTVNGVAPDEDGNISVTVGEGGGSEPATPMTADLLWENGSPSSSFAAQHVILNTLANYPLALIVAADYNTANFVTSICIVGMGGVLMGANTSNNYNLTRRYTITKGAYVAGAADVSFEGGYYNGSAANNRIVPLYIYGIK